MNFSNPTLMRCLYRVHQAKIHLRSAGAWFQGYARYLRPGTRAYRRHVDEELKHYREVHSDDGQSAAVAQENLFEPAPAAWDEIQALAKALIREQTGNDLDGHVISRLQSRPNVRLLSLGSGPGGVELGFARQAPESDIVCMDLNPDLLRLGEERAGAEHLRVCQGRSKFGPLRRSKSRPVGEGVAVFVGRLERSLRSPFRAAQA